MKKDILQIIDEYLKIFPEESDRQISLKKFLEENEENNIKDWNNFNGHIVVGGFIYAKEERKFLVLYHKDLKMFLYPGGHIDDNDMNLLETAKREIGEETGLYNLKEICLCNNKLIPFDIDTHLNPYNERLKLPEHFHYEFRYLFEVERIEEIVIDKEELQEFKWINIDELKKDINYGIIAKKIEKIIKKLGGRKIYMRELAVVVSNDNKNTNSIETIDAIKEAGFKNVFIQWYDKEWDISQEEQVEYIRKCELNVIFAHLGYQNINDIWVEGENGEKLVERYKNDIKVCKENNIHMVVMHLTSKHKAPMYNEIGLERIRKIVNYAKDLNIKVAFENTKIKGYLEYVFDNIKNDNIGLCYDAGHCHAHFDDEFNFEKFKDKIFAVHLHDNDKSDDQHLLPFDGTIEWKDVIEKLVQNGYGGPVVLELCYRYEYLNNTIEEFYKNGLEVGIKLAEMFENEDNKRKFCKNKSKKM